MREELFSKDEVNALLNSMIQKEKYNKVSRKVIERALSLRNEDLKPWLCQLPNLPKEALREMIKSASRELALIIVARKDITNRDILELPREYLTTEDPFHYSESIWEVIFRNKKLKISKKVYSIFIAEYSNPSLGYWDQIISRNDASQEVKEHIKKIKSASPKHGSISWIKQKSAVI